MYMNKKWIRSQALVEVLEIILFNKIAKHLRFKDPQ